MFVFRGLIAGLAEAENEQISMKVFWNKRGVPLDLARVARERKLNTTRESLVWLQRQLRVKLAKYMNYNWCLESEPLWQWKAGCC